MEEMFSGPQGDRPLGQIGRRAEWWQHIQSLHLWLAPECQSKPAMENTHPDPYS